MRYGMYELPKCVQSHILPGESIVTLVHSSSSVLGAGSLYVVLSAIIQMVSRRFTSHEFAGRSSFGIKLANSSYTMLAWSVHHLFLFKDFQLFLVTYPHSVVLETLIDNVKMKFFLPFCFVELLRIYLQFFSIVFLTQFLKKTTIHFSVCLLRS